QNSGLQVNCQDPNTPQTSGTFRVNVSAANGAECLSGSVTVTIRVEDVIVNAQNAPIGACGNLEGRSQAVTLTVNRQNTCLPTQRVNPTTPYSAGQMGNTVAADGNWALAIAPGDEEAGQDAGAAFVMRRNGNTWSV